MRYFIVLLATLTACGGSKNESVKDCLPLIDKAVASLQKYEFNRDSSQVDSALIYYDKAILCDPSNTSGHMGKLSTLAMLGRYRESLVVIKNAYKVHTVSPLAHAQLLMIQGVLYDRLSAPDSSAHYFKQSLVAYDSLLAKDPKDSVEVFRNIEELQPYFETNSSDTTLRSFKKQLLKVL